MSKWNDIKGGVSKAADKTAKKANELASAAALRIKLRAMNAKLSEKMWQGYVQAANATDIAYASPMEAECFGCLPAAYVETAEFDCLHDEGVAYAQAMQKAGIDVVLNETKGTMHGFDIVEKAPTTQAAVAARIGFMKEQFNKAINNKSED